ncbi:MAG: hypothetical protein JJU33_09860 [Phycisphaerales bacterium]|nr:hypothetical protein [Phycisphaerales bacterium]
MTRHDETPFTQRMRQTVEDCRKLKPQYNASWFQKLLDDCGGDFVPKAKSMLREELHKGLVTLAKRGNLELSMESVIANEPEWHGCFDEEDRDLAEERLRIAKTIGADGT